MATQGFTTEQFASVREVLETQLATGADIGASVCVHHRGEVVVDIWGGHTGAERTAAWQSDTLVNVWSTTKTMTFLVALMLADRGELDFNAPVATYWPEFAANGKAGIEVRHIMSHTAGLSGFGERIEPEDLGDWDKCVGILAAQEPWWEPGTMPGYHAITQGYLIGEIVRRITGVSIGTFFRTEVAEPLGADRGGEDAGRRRQRLCHQRSGCCPVGLGGQAAGRDCRAVVWWSAQHHARLCQLYPP